MEIAYLGPRGSFTEQAACEYGRNKPKKGMHTIEDVLLAVENGQVPEGIVPIENAIEGTVNATLDRLIFSRSLYIKEEIVLPIRQNMLVCEVTKGKKIEKIYSHPQALAQCKRFLSENYHGVDTIPVSSTSEAARIVSETAEPVAAIGTSLCAGLYGLTVLHKDTQDVEGNRTSFIVVSRVDTSRPAAGKKLSIAFSIFSEPGALYRILQILSLWDLNMTKIISRPMQGRMGEYVFYIDLEVPQTVQDVLDACVMVERKTNFFKVLGCYSVMDCAGS